MGRLLFLIDSFWFLVSTGLAIWVYQLRRKIAGLKDYRLWLPRKERRELARKALAEDADERSIARLEHNLGIINARQQEENK